MEEKEIREVETKDVPMVPKFWAETVIMHMSHANRRMLIALLAVCITFILTIIIFVRGYTEREKNWLETIAGMQQKPAVTEVDDGIQQQPGA